MDHKKPLTLSIIIPAYNEERHIKACLESIAAQDVMPDEVLMIDNNSTDTTIQIAETFPFVKVLREKQQGIVFGRNKGFNTSKCDILGRIDADSVLPQDWVARIREFYENSEHANHALTGGGYFYNLLFPPRAVNGWFLSQIAFRLNRFIMGHYIVWGSNMAITRTQWQTIKPHACEATNIHEDLDVAIHLHKANYTISYMADLSVGVYMKRAFDNWAHLHANLLWWPRTLRHHDNKKWLIGWTGAYVLFLASPILWPINKLLSILTSRPV